MNYALVLAGGKGKRFGAEQNKVLLPLLEKPILYYSLKAFQTVNIFDRIIIVSVKDERQIVEKIATDLDLKNYEIVYGGKERQDSVKNGLDAILEYERQIKDVMKSGDSIVLIHDGARPLVTAAEILSVYGGVKKYDACTLGVLAKDTIKKADKNDFVIDTLNRSELWQITTPQGFKVELLRRAFVEAEKDCYIGTDDCALVERMGKKVKLIGGSYKNIKITTKEDLLIAEAFLKNL